MPKLHTASLELDGGYVLVVLVVSLLLIESPRNLLSAVAEVASSSVGGGELMLKGNGETLIDGPTESVDPEGRVVLFKGTPYSSSISSSSSRRLIKIGGFGCGGTTGDSSIVSGMPSWSSSSCPPEEVFKERDDCPPRPLGSRERPIDLILEVELWKRRIREDVRGCSDVLCPADDDRLCIRSMPCRRGTPGEDIDTLSVAFPSLKPDAELEPGVE